MSSYNIVIALFAENLFSPHSVVTGTKTHVFQFELVFFLEFHFIAG